MSAPLEILLVTSNYPFDRRPNIGTFVAALAETWARQGDGVRVIAPLPIWSAQTGELILSHPTWSGPLKPTVVRPSFMSYSSRRVGPFSTARWTARSFERSVLRAARNLEARPDVVYSHFVLPAGAAGLRLARRLGRPAVVALGESGFEQADALHGQDRVAELLKEFDAILSVSRENKRVVVERYGVIPSSVSVFPNAVDTDRFRPYDRDTARRELRLPKDSVILSFTGHFIERKGPLRVLEAMKKVPGLFGVFLGEGEQMLSGERVLHAGRVPHDDVPRWLSASDFFALPTLAEGSPNAIIEAMACGLPVVSSDIPALHETAPLDAAILVDPMDIDALARAFERLARDPDLRARMSDAALAHGRQRSLDDRAARIRAWLRDLAGPR